MYCDFWNLTHAPFDPQLDLEFYYESELHEEALARLLFLAEEQKQCAILTGPGGTGKTFTLKVYQTILKRSPYQCEWMDLFGLGEEEFLWQLCGALRLGPAYTTPLPQLWRLLTDYLTGLQLTQDRVILLLDHVDQCRSDCLRAIQRLHHTGNQRFPSLTLVATANALNSDLAATIAPLSNLAIELDTLDQKMTAELIQYRLGCAGRETPLFTADAAQKVFQFTDGVPEKINQLCDLALLAGYEQNIQEIDANVITRAANEIKAAPVTTNRISEIMHGV